MPAAAPPDLRVAYDADGTHCKTYDQFYTQTFTNLTQLQKERLNNNAPETAIFNVGVDINQPVYFVIFQFPEPLTIEGVWATVGHGSTTIGGPGGVDPWAWSTDTTDGVDGTWTHFGIYSGVASMYNITWANCGVQVFAGVEPEVRDNVFLPGSPPANVRALRLGLSPTWTNNVWINSAAIYGHVTSPQWLEFWHPTLDQRLGPTEADWGFHDRGTSDVQAFRVKNCNGTNTILGVELGLGDISTDVPQAAASHTLSADGANYSPATTVDVGDLAPGEISQVFYVRRTTPANAVQGIYDLRIVPTFTGLSS